MTNSELMLWLIDHATDARWMDCLDEACRAYWVRPPVTYAERVTFLLACLKDLLGSDPVRWTPPDEPMTLNLPPVPPVGRELTAGEMLEQWGKQGRQT